MRSKRLAEISSVSAWRLLERLSRRRRKTPRRCVLGLSLGRGVRRSLATRGRGSPASSSPSCRGGYPGGDAELLHALLEVGADALDVGHRVAVGEQAEADRAVVADDRDRQRVAAGEEADRVDLDQLAAAHVEGDLRAGEVGDEQVEEPGREVDRRGRAEQQRRGEVAEPVVEAPDRLGAERLLGGLEVVHRLGDDSAPARPGRRCRPAAARASPSACCRARRARLRCGSRPAPAPAARPRRSPARGRASSGAGRRR